MKRIFLSIVVMLGLVGCTAESVWAPAEEVARARYVHGGQPSLTLVTVISNSSGSGGHTALLVNGSQRVIFDPAGTFYHPHLPERNDVHYGMTPQAMDFYIDYHARVTWHVVTQEIAVSPAVAEQALQLVQANGAVGKAACASSTSAILRQLPGFENIRSTPFPVPLMESFGRLSGVTEKVYRDNDPDNNEYMAAPALR
ncbi:hypothetical protein [Maritimibacter dapengensis]|uniref:Lipoprotein n=1 Tax=Maritimibacter dapengensis TaxID=2836868 RepID=A0ABS6T3E1_9RHOB|nr:hypothetical protein [Maritimibacter dapengensis]MBV7379748.1 hypothetical protein [Maritimibacter dapengensis]